MFVFEGRFGPTFPELNELQAEDAMLEAVQHDRVARRVVTSRVAHAWRAGGPRERQRRACESNAPDGMDRINE